MKKIKILFIHHASGWGGAPINMINIINELDKTQFEPHVLLLKDSIVKERLSEFNISYTVCNSYFYRKLYRYFSHSDARILKWYHLISIPRVLFSWFLSKYIYAPKVLKKHSFDIVHLNSSVLSDWVYPSSQHGKVVYHIQEPISRGYFGFRYKFIRSEVAKFADKIIAISKDNAGRINLPDKTEVVFNFTQIPDKIINSKTEKSILFVGGASKIKGIEVLIEALPLINKDIKVVIAGHFPELKPLSLVKKLKYKILHPGLYKLRADLEQITTFKNLTLIGTVVNIKEALQNSTLLISPFIVPHFSRPVIEAFAYSKPVIVSDVQGMDEIVDDKINGVILKNGDAKALADAINSLVNNQKLVETMGENGRLKALELYNPKRNISKCELIYRELMFTKSSTNTDMNQD